MSLVLYLDNGGALTIEPLCNHNPSPAAPIEDENAIVLRATARNVAGAALVARRISSKIVSDGQG